MAEFTIYAYHAKFSLNNSCSVTTVAIYVLYSTKHSRNKTFVVRLHTLQVFAENFCGLDCILTLVLATKNLCRDIIYVAQGKTTKTATVFLLKCFVLYGDPQ